MVEHDLTCVDIQFNSITHTYERDDGLESWPDHSLQVYTSLAGNFFSLHTLQFGSNLSYHLPLFADLALRPVSSTPISDHTGYYSKTNWQLVSDQDIERFHEYISSNLHQLSDDLLSCSGSNLSGIPSHCAMRISCLQCKFYVKSKN